MKLCLFIPKYLITTVGFDKDRWAKSVAGNLCDTFEKIKPLADLVSSRVVAGEQDEIIVDVNEHPDWLFLTDNPYVRMGRCNYMELNT